MAVVTFNSNMPMGLRLQAFFTPIVSGSLSTEGAESASFKVVIYQSPVDILYAGPQLSEAEGSASYLRFGPEVAPWITYGEPDGPALFSYQDLAKFHQQGALAAAFVMSGNDRLEGSDQGDYLEGYAGDDLLEGGRGADTLDGGIGNDIYRVDTADDRIFEAAGQGYDVVHTTANFAMALDAEIEELRAEGSATSLSLTGNGFRNLIVGTSAHDHLDGKGSADTLMGGAGNDLYIVDDAFDVVAEGENSGHDTVIAHASYALGENIEILKAGGGLASIGLIGNSLSNEIVGNLGANSINGLSGNDVLYGDGGSDRILGGLGDDTLYAGIGNDLLSGGDGADQLYGDTGRDTLDGGAGSDRLYGGTGDNRLVGQDGNDTLYGSMHLDTLQGGAGNDRIFGDSGNDHLEGGAGKDILSGGWGKDIFTFRDRLSATTNVDTIADFNVSDDTIRLENSIFRKLGKPGKLKPDLFTIGSKAQDANDYLIYSKSKGYLSYDADGSGTKHKPILFAKLKSGLALSEKDFYVL